MRVVVEFYKHDVNVEMTDRSKFVSLNGVDRYDTNRKIAELIGTYDDLTVTSISLQNKSNAFIEMPQSNRKKLLNDLLRLDFYEKLHEQANSDLRSKAQETKLLARTFKVDKLDGLEDTIKNHQKQLHEIGKIITNTNEEITNSQREKEQMLRGIHQINNDIQNLDIDQLRKQLATHQQRFAQIETHDSQIKELQTLIDDAESVYRDEMEQYHKVLGEIKAEIATYRSKFKEPIKIPSQFTVNKLNELKSILENSASKPFVDRELLFLKDIHVKLEVFEGEDEINYVQSKITDRKKYLGGLPNGQSYSGKGPISMGQIVRYLQQHEQNAKLNEENKEYQQKLSELQQELQQFIANKPDNQSGKFRTQLQNIQDKLTQKNACEREIIRIKPIIQQWDQEQVQIGINKQIEKQVRKKDAELNGYKIKLHKMQQRQTTLNSDVSVIRQEIGKIKEAMQKIAILEQQTVILKEYCKCVHKDGIPYKLLQEVIPYLEQKVNSILTLIADFTVQFNMDGKNIDITLNRASQQVNILMASGFEKFIASISVRVAMMNISMLPKPNFMAIDEGFGAFDAENLGGVGQLFDYLRGEFDIVMIISHIDMLKNEVDHIICPDDLKQHSVQVATKAKVSKQHSDQVAKQHLDQVATNQRVTVIKRKPVITKKFKRQEIDMSTFKPN